MVDRQRKPPPDDLEQRLTDLGQQLDWPADPNLLPKVRQRLSSVPVPRSRRAWFASQPLAWASIGLVLITVLVLAVSGSTRSTVADRLGLSGVSISSDPTVTATSGSDLDIGNPTTLDDALRVTGGNLLLPPTDLLGSPDEIDLREADGTIQVSYLYRPDDELPEAGDSGVGLLISQFDGNTNQSFIQKQLGSETTVELTEVNGQTAFWLAGAPHVFFYEHPDGSIREESIRLAANVLLWETNGKTIRIESQLDQASVIAIAESMRHHP